MKCDVTTVDEHLDTIHEERKLALKKIIGLIKKHTSKAKEELVYNMPSYVLGEPIFSIASQKHYMALYTCYNETIEKYRGSLGSANIGKGSIRFKKLEDLDLEVVAELIKETYDGTLKSQ